MAHVRWGEHCPPRGGARYRRRKQRLATRLLLALFAGGFVLGSAAGADTPPAPEAGEIAEPEERKARRGADRLQPDETQAPLNRKPILVKSVPPEYPKEFTGSGVNAEVVVSMLVDRMGRASHIRVEGSPDKAFTDAALAALAGFEFLPAIKNGKVSNASVQMTVQVREDLGDKSLVDYEGGKIELLATNTDFTADTPIRRLFGPRPAYPLEMLAAGKSGEVLVEFSVGADGIPRQPKIVEATFVEFAHAVEGAIALWKYSPALNGARPVTTALRYRVSFQADEVPQAMRDIAKRLLSGDTRDVVSAKQLDAQPRARARIEPAAPAGDEKRVRRADVVFMVDAKGVVRFPRVIQASDAVSGYIALAAVNYWTFDPAMRKKEPVPVLVTLPFRF